jgi:hypothetical protein
MDEYPASICMMEECLFPAFKIEVPVQSSYLPNYMVLSLPGNCNCNWNQVKRVKLKGGWKRLHKEKLNGLYASPNIAGVIKSRTVRWARHVACMKE